MALGTLFPAYHLSFSGPISLVSYPFWHVKVLVTQSCPALLNPMDDSLPRSSVHGILQARILESVAIPFSRGSSWPRDQTQVSHIVDRFFTVWAIREAPRILLWVAPNRCHQIGGSKPAPQLAHTIFITSLEESGPATMLSYQELWI